MTGETSGISGRTPHMGEALSSMGVVNPEPETHSGFDTQRREKQRLSVRVDIYVAEHCPVCQYAFEVAERIEVDFPDVNLHVVDIAQSTEPIPEAVFATPTYLLNGKLWSLGNPSPEDVQERLSTAVEERQNQIAGSEVK